MTTINQAVVEKDAIVFKGGASPSDNDQLLKIHATAEDITAVNSTTPVFTNIVRFNTGAAEGATVIRNLTCTTKSDSSDAATKQYVDDEVDKHVASMAWKSPVKTVSEVHVDITNPGTDIGGRSSGWADGDRILLAGQGIDQDGATTAAANRIDGGSYAGHIANGIYVWTAATATMERALDMDGGPESEAVDASAVFIQEGTHAETAYVCTQGKIANQTDDGSDIWAGVALLNPIFFV